MGRERVARRILGIASTTRGFAFALTEGPATLLSWEHRRFKADRAQEKLEKLIRRTRPHHLAFEHDTVKRERGEKFKGILEAVCRDYRIPLVTVTMEERKALAKTKNATKREVGVVIARNFPEIAHHLPKPRKVWQSEDDRIGIFIAVADAVVAWMKISS